MMESTCSAPARVLEAGGGAASGGGVSLGGTGAGAAAGATFSAGAATAGGALATAAVDFTGSAGGIAPTRARPTDIQTMATTTNTADATTATRTSGRRGPGATSGNDESVMVGADVAGTAGGVGRVSAGSREAPVLTAAEISCAHADADLGTGAGRAAAAAADNVAGAGRGSAAGAAGLAGAAPEPSMAVAAGASRRARRRSSIGSLAGSSVVNLTPMPLGFTQVTTPSPANTTVPSTSAISNRIGAPTSRVWCVGRKTPPRVTLGANRATKSSASGHFRRRWTAASSGDGASIHVSRRERNASDDAPGKLLQQGQIVVRLG